MEFYPVTKYTHESIPSSYSWFCDSNQPESIIVFELETWYHILMFWHEKLNLITSERFVERWYSCIVSVHAGHHMFPSFIICVLEGSYFELYLFC